ncbi:hypothetical protein [Chondromyces apiculatus]|uniref:Uncharacterized protein n=1 Tax=Chondromyces apiculatus DSM 436 TaxID=1192034 RepID=A0A017TJL5_9BACT|nr:hypothetical protein [Chondromyces apiculatus]EYF08841.1 Hypothetical protein CAP_2702 [Chondromyces apiculatus DSM 436]
MLRGSSPRWTSSLLSAAALTAALTAAFTAGMGTASAQEKVTGTGKGIVGTALLGGEAVMIGMGAFGVEATWPYLVFGSAGMIAGGIGGWAIEGAAPPAEVPLYLLAGGMALIIPTVVVTLNATAYSPPEERDEPLKNEPSPDGPKVEGDLKVTSQLTSQRTRPAAHPRPRPALGLLDLDPQRVAFGLPAPDVRPLYSPQEMLRFGVTQGQEFRFSVVRAAF